MHMANIPKAYTHMKSYSKRRFNRLDFQRIVPKTQYVGKGKYFMSAVKICGVMQVESCGGCIYVQIGA